jgi:hypothetical protein
MDQSSLTVAKQHTAATLAAGIIAASGRPHSIAEALALRDDVYWALYPEPGNGAYDTWAKTKDVRLNKARV